MTGSFSDRNTFRALRTRGIRVRRGHLSVVFLGDASAGSCRVAYAMTKQLGSAVTRNRLRRRLRHLVDREVRAGNVPSGDLLISAGPAATGLGSQELSAQVSDLFRALLRRIDTAPVAP